MAIIPDGSMLPPVSQAVCLCPPVAGERGWEGAVALVSCMWIPGQWLVGYCVNRMLD